MNVTVIAPHADDETLGCGGAMLKHLEAGDTVQWVLVTKATERWSREQRVVFTQQIDNVHQAYIANGRIALIDLGYPAAGITEETMVMLIRIFEDLFTPGLHKETPDLIYIPGARDRHSDHRYVHQATLAATKRMFHVELRECEIPSETPPGFTPNLYVDISKQISEKLRIYGLYQTEVQSQPNPRSINAVASLAEWRGQECGSHYAEAFRVLRARR